MKICTECFNLNVYMYSHAYIHTGAFDKAVFLIEIFSEEINK